MLDEHLFDRLRRQVGVDRFAAGFIKSVEGVGESVVRFALRLDLFFERVGDVGDLLSELCRRRFPFAEFGLFIFKQHLQRFDQVGWFGEVGVQRVLPVLNQDRLFGRLEKDVVERVAHLPFLLNRFGEIVMDVFRFPVGERQAEFMQDSAIDEDVAAAALHSIFALARRVHLFCAVLHERVERGADGAFFVGAMRV